MRFKVPHTLVLLFGMILVAQVLTWVLPQGTYQRFENAEGREEVVAGSYQHLDQAERLEPWGFLTAVPRGFAAAGDIIFFVFLIGGAFGVFRATGSADALIGRLLDRLGGKPWALVLGGVLLFALGSSTIGMAEEYLPFVPILVALCLGLGFDRLTAVGILCVGYSVGYGCAAINPFTVLIAQGVAGLPPTSGLWFRLALFLPFLAVGVHHVLRYAHKVQAHPELRLLAEGDEEGVHADAVHPPWTGPAP